MRLQKVVYEGDFSGFLSDKPEDDFSFVEYEVEALVGVISNKESNSDELVVYYAELCESKEQLEENTGLKVSTLEPATLLQPAFQEEFAQIPDNDEWQNNVYKALHKLVN